MIKFIYFKGKNEVTVEFHQNDDALVSLMEMRFYVPSTSDGEDPVKVSCFPFFYLMTFLESYKSL